ncbi:hypothetical protein EVG20_g7147 [Dentipellis fragilis]|uniref:Peptidase S54 rhomboid domain-containing protein n=1 Tax=Dentipellis fragilis TaxID=205917 RepID=A0A4Y9YHJ5_9AGAM|nr:hypothetical protein EVG20_g7147 [Dentipellis fragilis]
MAVQYWETSPSYEELRRRGHSQKALLLPVPLAKAPSFVDHLHMHPPNHLSLSILFIMCGYSITAGRTNEIIDRLKRARRDTSLPRETREFLADARRVHERYVYIRMEKTSKMPFPAHGVARVYGDLHQHCCLVGLADPAPAALHAGKVHTRPLERESVHDCDEPLQPRVVFPPPAQQRGIDNLFQNSVHMDAAGARPSRPPRTVCRIIPLLCILLDGPGTPAAGLFSAVASHHVATDLVLPRAMAQIMRNPLAKFTSAPLSKWASWAKTGASPAVSTSSSAGTIAGADATTYCSPAYPGFSLGASGLAYATLTLSALAFPNGEFTAPDGAVSYVIPGLGPFPLGYAAGGLVLLDCLGVLRGWRMFDHYIHLAGAVIGASYWVVGPGFWNGTATIDWQSQRRDMIWLARVRPSLSSRAHLHHTRSYSFAWRSWLPKLPQPLKNAVGQADSEALPKVRGARSNTTKSFTEYVKYPEIRYQIGTAIVASGLIYYIAARITNQETLATERLIADPAHSDLPKDVRQANKSQMRQDLVRRGEETLQYISFAPTFVRNVFAILYVIVAKKYLNAREGERASYWIIGINCAVWMAWQVPRFRPFMRAHLTHDPLSGKAYTMLTSMFRKLSSHASFLHLLSNSAALLGLSSVLSIWMVHTQDTASRLPQARELYHFFAFFISANLFSTLISHHIATRVVFPRIISQISQNPSAVYSTTPVSRWTSFARTSAGRNNFVGISSTKTSTASATSAAAGATASQAVPHILPSLGSSGATCAAFMLTALTYRTLDSNLIIPFVSLSFGVPMIYGVGGLMFLSYNGILRGWRLFDHGAHLGGAAFGMAYSLHGFKFWDWVRRHVGGEKPSERSSGSKSGNPNLRLNRHSTEPRARHLLTLDRGVAQQQRTMTCLTRLQSGFVRRAQRRHNRVFSFTSPRWLPRPPSLKIAETSHKAIPLFHEQVALSTPQKASKEHADLRSHGVVYQIGYALVLSAFIYQIAARQTNELTYKYEALAHDLTPDVRHALSKTNSRFVTELRVVNEVRLVAHLKDGAKLLGERISSAPKIVQDTVTNIYAFAANKYRHTLDGERATYWIVGINTAVWLIWQVPRFRPFMRTHFTHNPFSGKGYTMVTSMFSHASFFHLLFDSTMLIGLSQTVSGWMMLEQDRPGCLKQSREIYHFFAFFISANLFSTLVSHHAAVYLASSRAVNQISHNPLATAISVPLSKWISFARTNKNTTVATTADSSMPHILPSLGSSGANCAAYAISALKFRSNDMSSIFPMVKIPLPYGLEGLALLTYIGMVRGWSLFNHYAHAGGLAFGILYWMQGTELWDWTRRHVSGNKPGENVSSAS